MEENTITYEQVEERLKNKSKEKWTKDDVFDRYVGYGSIATYLKIKIFKK